MVELNRLRNEIILAASKTIILKQIYAEQQEQASCRSIKIDLETSVSFINLLKKDFAGINFVDQGPSHHLQIDLAVKEFDPSLISNSNFMNPDSLKFNILNSGLEEVRGILQYQLLQKNLLVVATRSNYLVLEHHLKANSELNLLLTKEGYSVALPNPTVNLQSVINRSTDSIEAQKIKDVRSSYKSNLSTCFGPGFYDVQTKKSQFRSQMARNFTNYQNQGSSQYENNIFCTLRAMRCFKLKLLTQFVQKIVIEVALDAQKIQALTACQRLREVNRYFNFDPKVLGLNGEPPAVFKYETNSLIENFPANYLPDEFNDEDSDIFTKKIEVKAFNTSNLQIINYSVIPSSASILSVNTSSTEEIREFTSRRNILKSRFGYPEDIKQVQLDEKDPEKHLRALIPQFTPIGIEQVIPTKRNISEKEVQKLEFKTDSPPQNYQQALYFGDSKFAEICRHYMGLERIILMEWFITKLQFKSKETVFLDQAIQSGLPFWKRDGFDQRVVKELEKMAQKNKGKNLRSQDFLYNQVVGLRQKIILAEEVSSFSQIMKNFLNQLTLTKQEQKSDYLQNYTEFRYLQIVGSLHKLVQQFHHQKNNGGVFATQTLIAQLTKMDHIRVKMICAGNFNINTSLVHPNMQVLEPGNLIFGSVQIDQIYNFHRCVQPIINEKALEPGQITLFQSIYQNDNMRRSIQNQFFGQTSSVNCNPFQALEAGMLQLTYAERQYSQGYIVQSRYQANDFMETVYADSSLNALTNEDAYDIYQLKDAKGFLEMNTQALLLKNAVVCWNENSSLPSNWVEYKKFEENFKTSFFWRILQYKSQMQIKWGKADGIEIPTQEQMRDLKEKIDNFSNDKTIATKTAQQKRDLMVTALKEEFGAMKKKVTLDTYFTTKAEIELYSNELEKYLMQASIAALENECTALAKCFTVQVPQIQFHIHPFQQFASTFFDRVDPNSHLDISNKISAVQVLLTKLKNRGTAVETLTSGPGMVFTIKDINECLIDFSRSMITYGEKELKSRSDLQLSLQQHYQDVLYMKDRKISWLEHRLERLSINLETIIDARMFEKGNQLIFELDSSNRILTMFKKSYSGLEQFIINKIEGEQDHKFKRQENLIEKESSKYTERMKQLKRDIQRDLEGDNEVIKEVLKQKVSQIVLGVTKYKSPVFYPIGNNTNTTTGAKKGQPNVQQHMTGAVVPEGFKHYSFCSCYVPDPRFPKPTLEHAEIQMMSELEARTELARMCDLVRKQRLLWRTKEMCQQQKYQDKINVLMKQQSNNSYLWEQMAESQKRERVLQQELRFAQQSLGAAEKVIEKLQKEIKELDADRARLNKFKTSKTERLKELEEAVHEYEIKDNIDLDKLIMQLTNKDDKIKNLTHIKEIYDMSTKTIEKRKKEEIQAFKVKFQEEQHKTQIVIDRLDNMKMEMKMLDQSESTVSSIWKKKCLDIFQVCQTLRVENEELRIGCKELIQQGIDLAEHIESYEKQTTKIKEFNPTQQANKFDRGSLRVSFTGSNDDATRSKLMLIKETPQKAEISTTLEHEQKQWLTPGVEKRIPQKIPHTSHQKHRTDKPSSNPYHWPPQKNGIKDVFKGTAQSVERQLAKSEVRHKDDKIKSNASFMGRRNPQNDQSLKKQETILDFNTSPIQFTQGQANQTDGFKTLNAQGTQIPNSQQQDLSLNKQQQTSSMDKNSKTVSSNHSHTKLASLKQEITFSQQSRKKILMSAQKIAVMHDKETLKTSGINTGAVTEKNNEFFSQDTEDRNEEQNTTVHIHEQKSVHNFVQSGEMKVDESI